MKKEKLYNKGYEKFSPIWIISQNILLLLYFTIGTFGISHIKINKIPVISIIYALFIFSMLVFILRKFVCTSCYYYGKNCNTGWGKLASFLFKKDSKTYKSGFIMALLTWGSGLLFPAVIMIITLLISYSKSLLVTLIIFIIFGLITTIFHAKSCRRCKRKFTCSGSMAKKNNIRAS